MDNQKRIAVVETLTIGEGIPIANPVPVLRYQLDNHLGSASLELDEAANIISYEEYYPYGDSSYRAGRNIAETGLKLYRYTGKEKDEESSLYYHGARYYACWLGRWTASDPAGLVDGVNLYAYVNGNPVRYFDDDGRSISDHVEYLKGAGDALTRFVTGGATVGEIQDEYSKNGLAAAVGKSTMLTKYVSENYREAGGGIKGTLNAAFGLTLPGMAANAAKKMASTVKSAYNSHGGGVEGVAGVVDTLNPIAHIRDSGAEAIDAMKKGDMRKSGDAVTNTLVKVGFVAAMFATGGAKAPEGGRVPQKSVPERAPRSEGVQSRPVSELRAEGLKDAHHIVQDAAVRDLAGYQTKMARGVQLEGPSTLKGSPHYNATQVQWQAGGGTLGAELRIGYKAMRRGGVPAAEARLMTNEAGEYFKRLGYEQSTPTRIPGNRR